MSAATDDRDQLIPVIVHRPGLPPGGPYVLACPAPWEVLEKRRDGFACIERGLGLTVIVSVAQEADNRAWLHVSCSRPDRLPSYDDLCLVKAEFVGADRKAIQVFPAQAEHVNIHLYCLHLFSCLDEDPLPDFTGGAKTL